MLKINLQPKVVVEVKEGFQMPVWVPIALGIAIALTMISFYVSMNTRIITAKAEIRQLAFDLRDFQQILNDFEDATNEKKYLTGKRDFVAGISQNQMMWLEFLDALAGNMPTDVWVSRFDAKRMGEYTLEGNTYTYSAIGFFMLQLNSIDFIKSVNMTGASGGMLGAGGAAGKTTADALAKKFTIQGTLDLTPRKKLPGT